MLSKIQISKLWRRRESPTSPTTPSVPGDPEALTPAPEQDNETQMEGINQEKEEEVDFLVLAVEENSRLQETVQSLQWEVDSLRTAQQQLESKVDDLDQKLQLERRRVEWQKKFYERKIVEAVIHGRDSVGVEGANGTAKPDPEQLLATLSQAFYQEMIKDLVMEQEKKEEELKDMHSTFQSEIRALEERQKEQLTEMEESHVLKMQEVVGSHEELIRDLLRGCEEGLFKEMKEEYLVEAEKNMELQTTTGNSVWVQFQRFSSEKKGIIIVGICIVTVATAGWAGWGFITWVWPRLVVFAESIASNPQQISVWTSYLVRFLNSPQFQTFVMTWEQGQPLASCMKSFLNTALLASALQMAPSLLSQLKNRKTKAKA